MVAKTIRTVSCGREQLSYDDASEIAREVLREDRDGLVLLDQGERPDCDRPQRDRVRCIGLAAGPEVERPGPRHEDDFHLLECPRPPASLRHVLPLAIPAGLT